MSRISETQRRKQLIACAEAVARLADHREIVPTLAALVEHDLEIRPVLETVVRRWSRLTPLQYTTVGATRGLHRKKVHVDHVVPCRVLVDRMIINPRECRALLETAVLLARVTAAEHQRLGGIYTHHERLYGRMLRAPVERLAALGRERYRASGIVLRRLTP